MNATGNHSAALAVLKEHSKTDLTTDFEPNVQFRLEPAVAQSACDEDDEAADTAGVLVEFFDHHLDFERTRSVVFGANAISCEAKRPTRGPALHRPGNQKLCGQPVQSRSTN
jgi:hypothetical protein